MDALSHLSSFDAKVHGKKFVITYGKGPPTSLPSRKLKMKAEPSPKLGLESESASNGGSPTSKLPLKKVLNVALKAKPSLPAKSPKMSPSTPVVVPKVAMQGSEGSEEGKSPSPQMSSTPTVVPKPLPVIKAKLTPSSIKKAVPVMPTKAVGVGDGDGDPDSKSHSGKSPSETSDKEITDETHQSVGLALQALKATALVKQIPQLEELTKSVPKLQKVKTLPPSTVKHKTTAVPTAAAKETETSTSPAPVSKSETPRAGSTTTSIVLPTAGNQRVLPYHMEILFNEAAGKHSALHGDIKYFAHILGGEEYLEALRNAPESLALADKLPQLDMRHPSRSPNKPLEDDKPDLQHKYSAFPNTQSINSPLVAAPYFPVALFQPHGGTVAPAGVYPSPAYFVPMGMPPAGGYHYSSPTTQHQNTQASQVAPTRIEKSKQLVKGTLRHQTDSPESKEAPLWHAIQNRELETPKEQKVYSNAVGSSPWKKIEHQINYTRRNRKADEESQEACSRRNLGKSQQKTKNGDYNVRYQTERLKWGEEGYPSAVKDKEDGSPARKAKKKVIRGWNRWGHQAGITAPRKRMYHTLSEMANYFADLDAEDQSDVISLLLSCRKLEKQIEEQHLVVDMLEHDLQEAQKVLKLPPEWRGLLDLSLSKDVSPVPEVPFTEAPLFLRGRVDLLPDDHNDTEAADKLRYYRKVAGVPVPKQTTQEAAGATGAPNNKSDAGPPVKTTDGSSAASKEKIEKATKPALTLGKKKLGIPTKPKLNLAAKSGP